MANETTKPNPGSEEAIALGCSCPVIDNAHGRGYMGVEGMFVYSAGCKLHWPEVTDPNPPSPSKANPS